MPASTSEPQLKTSLIIHGHSAQTESNNGAVTKPHPTHRASYINNPWAAKSRSTHPGKGAPGALEQPAIPATDAAFPSWGDAPHRHTGISGQLTSEETGFLILASSRAAVGATGGSPTLSGTWNLGKCLGRCIRRPGRTGSFCVSLSS